jgi:hypothetical protein
MTSKAQSRVEMGDYCHLRTTFRSEYAWNRRPAFFRTSKISAGYINNHTFEKQRTHTLCFDQHSMSALRREEYAGYLEGAGHTDE